MKTFELYKRFCRISGNKLDSSGFLGACDKPVVDIDSIAFRSISHRGGRGGFGIAATVSTQLCQRNVFRYRRTQTYANRQLNLFCFTHKIIARTQKIINPSSVASSRYFPMKNRAVRSIEELNIFVVESLQKTVKKETKKHEKSALKKHEAKNTTYVLPLTLTDAFCRVKSFVLCREVPETLSIVVATRSTNGQ